MVYENSPHPVVRDRLIAGDEEKRPARHLQETTEHFGRFFFFSLGCFIFFLGCFMFCLGFGLL